jgi:hypothetical protein
VSVSKGREGEEAYVEEGGGAAARGVVVVLLEAGVVVECEVHAAGALRATHLDGLLVGRIGRHLVRHLLHLAIVRPQLTVCVVDKKTISVITFM